MIMASAAETASAGRHFSNNNILPFKYHLSFLVSKQLTDDTEFHLCGTEAAFYREMNFILPPTSFSPYRLMVAKGNAAFYMQVTGLELHSGRCLQVSWATHSKRKTQTSHCPLWLNK